MYELYHKPMKPTNTSWHVGYANQHMAIQADLQYKCLGIRIASQF
jgi:hypothetical protein